MQFREIENAIERLIRWAATALEKSSNQPMLPFAFIVINAVDNRTDEKWLDVATATTTVLHDIRDAVDKNPTFSRWAWDWRQKKNKRIDTTEDLLRAYYTSVQFIFIPDKDHPKLVSEQYNKLHTEIKAAVSSSAKRRHRARLLLSSDQFNPYLQFAFEHFSKTLDEPFDFVRASSAFNQLQRPFNPVLCLIKDYQNNWPDVNVSDLFADVAPLVASATMLDFVRRQLKGKYVSQSPFLKLFHKF